MAMHSDSHRLWKQIGNQTHKIHQASKRVQETAQSGGKFEKNVNQQFEHNPNQSIVIEQLSKLQFSDIKQLHNDEGLSFHLNKPTEQYDYLELVLKQLEGQKSGETINKKKASINVHKNHDKFTQKYRNEYSKIKLILLDCKNQFVKIQTYVRQELQKSQQSQLKAMKDFALIQEMLQLKISMLNKQNFDKQQQLKIIKQLYQSKCQIQKNLYLQIKQSKQREVKAKQQVKQLQNFNRNLIIEKQKLQKQLQDQAQKIFDIEQKLLSFDMRVQDKVNQIIEKNHLSLKSENVAPEENSNKNSKCIGSSRLGQNILIHSTERENISEQQNTQDDYNKYYHMEGLCRKLATDYFGSTFCSDKEYVPMNMSYSVKKLQNKSPMKHFRQNIGNSNNKSVSMRASLNTVFQTPMHNHSQNLSTRMHTYERQRYSPAEKQRFSPFSSQKFHKKSLREAQKQREKRPAQIEKISKKLNNIKVKIQQQINSILHY